MKSFMKSLKEYIDEGLLDRVKNKEVNHDALIKEFLEANYEIDGSYSIKDTNNKLVVDVKGNIETINKNITSLTNGLFEFGVVSGGFYCNYCRSLTSLEGAPTKVGGNFSCSCCGSLTTLKGAPQKVDWDFSCPYCGSLKSLEGAPENVGEYFNCGWCDSLTSLEGAPQKVENFNCCSCKSLTHLKGCPKKVVKNFDCSNCESLKSLEGAPQKVGFNFYCYDCGEQFTEDDVRKYTTVARTIWV